MSGNSRDLTQEIERMAGLAGRYGLNIDDDLTVVQLCTELAEQFKDINRTESKRDIVQAALEKVSSRHEGQEMLNKIQRETGREPTIGELLKAAYAQPKEVDRPVQPPPEGASATALLNYYYKYLSTSAEKKE